MGILLYRLREEALEKLKEIHQKINEERYRCITNYRQSEYYSNRYDLNYYLISKCDVLNDLYIQANKLTKKICR